MNKLQRQETFVVQVLTACNRWHNKRKIHDHPARKYLRDTEKLYYLVLENKHLYRILSLKTLLLLNKHSSSWLVRKALALLSWGPVFDTVAATDHSEWFFFYSLTLTTWGKCRDGTFHSDFFRYYFTIHVVEAIDVWSPWINANSNILFRIKISPPRKRNLTAYSSTDWKGNWPKIVNLEEAKLL